MKLDLLDPMQTKFAFKLEKGCLASPLWVIGPDLAEGERVAGDSIKLDVRYYVEKCFIIALGENKQTRIKNRWLSLFIRSLFIPKLL